ncbi:MAG: JAB domain-containing protein [bacterium]
MKKRFVDQGNLDNFEEHQILELLLFYSIPRKDTNELAHKILKEYGCLYDLFNASPKEISKRCNVTMHTSILMTMMPCLFRRFLLSEQNKSDITISTKHQANNYFKSLLVAKPIENFYVAYLDINKKVIKTIKMSEGNTNQSVVYVEKVVSNAILYNAEYVVLGHNHPNGNKKPSNSDFEITHQIVNALGSINIKVLDHIIICNTGYYSFAGDKNCGLSYNIE